MTPKSRSRWCAILVLIFLGCSASAGRFGKINAPEGYRPRDSSGSYRDSESYRAREPGFTVPHGQPVSITGALEPVVHPHIEIEDDGEFVGSISSEHLQSSEPAIYLLQPEDAAFFMVHGSNRSVEDAKHAEQVRNSFRADDDVTFGVKATKAEISAFFESHRGKTCLLMLHNVGSVDSPVYRLNGGEKEEDLPHRQLMELVPSGTDAIVVSCKSVALPKELQRHISISEACQIIYSTVQEVRRTGVDVREALKHSAFRLISEQRRMEALPVLKKFIGVALVIVFPAPAAGAQGAQGGEDEKEKEKQGAKAQEAGKSRAEAHSAPSSVKGRMKRVVVRIEGDNTNWWLFAALSIPILAVSGVALKRSWVLSSRYEKADRITHVVAGVLVSLVAVGIVYIFVTQVRLIRINETWTAMILFLGCLPISTLVGFVCGMLLTNSLLAIGPDYDWDRKALIGVVGAPAILLLQWLVYNWALWSDWMGLFKFLGYVLFIIGLFGFFGALSEMKEKWETEQTRGG